MSVSDNDGYYSEYLNRGRGGQSSALVKKWHERVWNMFVRLMGQPFGSSPLRVFEVGYGHGYFANVVIGNRNDYLGTDISRALLDAASAAGHRVVHPDDLDFDGLQGTCDVVWLSHVLEHCDGWKEAREFVERYAALLTPDGVIVVVGPDLLSWKHHFWSADFSHGFGTTRRNVVQLLSDVGLEVSVSAYHRGGSNSLLTRAFFRLLTMVPHRFLDWVCAPSRSRRGEGPFSSMKFVLGWRQLIIAATPSRARESSGEP